MLQHVQGTQECRGPKATQVRQTSIRNTLPWLCRLGFTVACCCYTIYSLYLLLHARQRLYQKLRPPALQSWVVLPAASLELQCSP